MTQNARDRGRDAELACCRYLQQKGLKLLAKNYHGRRGEVDLVMQDRHTVVFVEVRYRRNSDFGGALESITSSKQQKLRLTAEQYMQREYPAEMQPKQKNQYPANFLKPVDPFL